MKEKLHLVTVYKTEKTFMGGEWKLIHDKIEFQKRLFRDAGYATTYAISTLQQLADVNRGPGGVNIVREDSDYEVSYLATSNNGNACVKTFWYDMEELTLEDSDTPDKDGNI